MAGIDTGTKSGRSVNQDINMIPFIDLLMVTIAFLLITAVWVTHSRIDMNAQMPGSRSGPITDGVAAPLILHLHARDAEFALVWRQGTTVVEETQLERREGASSYDELATTLEKQWTERGSHRDMSDLAADRVVFHSHDQMLFGEIVMVMDAVYKAKRIYQHNDEKTSGPVFTMAFAAK